MNEEMASGLKNWLESFGPDRARDVVVVKVTFKGKRKEETRYGCRWLQVLHYTEGMRCVQEGMKKVGEGYTELRIDLLGERPECTRKRNRHGEQKIVHRTPGDEGDWYVSSYYEEGEKNEYHPFGNSFSMSRWPHESPLHDRIDKYDEKPRERREMVVSIL